MSLLDNFIKYTKIYTTSDENSLSTPSSTNQLVLQNILLEQLKNFGLTPILDKYGRLYCTIEGNLKYDAIGFCAHVDTASDVSGKNVMPRVIENYDGQDIALNKEYKIDIINYPTLNNHIGKTLIVTDGTTLLGGDDKCGVAIIMDFIERYVKLPQQLRRTVYILFTPDEEIGRGADYFNNDLFKAKYAYTFDGGAYNEINIENFNAFGMDITITGVSIHTGDAKGIMVNAIEVFSKLANILPPKETPFYTENREGFYHLCDINGTSDEIKFSLIIRDHDLNLAKNRVEAIIECINKIQNQYPTSKITYEVKEQYLNMYEVIKDNLQVVKCAEKAFDILNLKYEFKPIRGGTDGARITYLGVPMINLGTGSYNHHSRHEYAVLEEMEILVKIALQIAAV